MEYRDAVAIELYDAHTTVSLGGDEQGLTWEKPDTTYTLWGDTLEKLVRIFDIPTVVLETETVLVPPPDQAARGAKSERGVTREGVGQVDVDVERRRSYILVDRIEVRIDGPLMASIRITKDGRVAEHTLCGAFSVEWEQAG